MGRAELWGGTARPAWCNGKSQDLGPSHLCCVAVATPLNPLCLIVLIYSMGEMILETAGIPGALTAQHLDVGIHLILIASLLDMRI